MSFNLQEVERELHKMQPRQKLYELVKREMQRRERQRAEFRQRTEDQAGLMPIMVRSYLVE